MDGKGTPMDAILHRYPHMLQEYYVARMREWDAKRRALRAEVKTRGEALRLQREVRAAVRASFGPWPERTPLNARVTGVVERPSYRIEKVLYESRPAFLVTANLYVPKRLAGRAPCVLGLCGHSGNGKAADPYQSFGHGLAMKGFVCLIIDPISQGERVQYPNAQKRCKLGLCPEHNMVGCQQALAGEFFGMWRAWDAMRGLDYLLSRDEADPKRAGVTGISGGGTLSTWMLALDERLTMGAPGCFVTTFLANLENEVAADVEQIPPQLIAMGVDQPEMLMAMAPKPVLIMAPRNDFFDYRGVVDGYRGLKRIWRLLGAEENLRLYSGPGTHGYSKDLREAMYGFFAKHSGLKVASQEPRLRLEPEEGLWATKRGLAVREGSRLVLDFTRAKAETLAKRRGRVAPARLRQILAETLVLPKRQGPPHHRILATMRVGTLRFQNFALDTEPGIQALVTAPDLPGWRTPPPAGKRCHLLVPHVAAHEDLTLPKVKRLFSGRAPVFAVDVRGVGQSMPILGETTETTGPFTADYLHHCYGLMMGEPLLGRRVHDVLSTLDWLESLGYDDVRLVGRGFGAMLALLAATLDDRPTNVTLLNGLSSWHELTQVPVYAWPAAWLPAGVLRKFDLSDCHRALKGKLRIVEPWDARMRPA